MSDRDFERWEEAASDKIDMGFEWIVAIATVAAFGLIVWALSHA